MTIYKLVWDDFCSWLLEMVKPEYQQQIDAKTHQEIINIFEDNLKILHPFMPFLTEEIWQFMGERTPEDALIIAKYPNIKSYDEALISDFEMVKDVVSGIRTIRKDKNISFKETIELSVLNNENLSSNYNSVIQKMGNVSRMETVSQAVEGALSFRIQSNEYFIPITGNINIEEEILKLNEELKYTEGFLKSVQVKLSNEKFVANAKPEIIQNERNKEADALAKIETLKASLASLK